MGKASKFMATDRYYGKTCQLGLAGEDAHTVLRQFNLGSTKGARKRGTRQASKSCRNVNDAGRTLEVVLESVPRTQSNLGLTKGDQ